VENEHPVSEPGVSVVVSTARPDHMMDACTAAIGAAAVRSSEPVELIIVDDRDVPIDERRAEHEIRDGLQIRRLWSRDAGASGQAQARNLGVAVARYDLLALTDDDTRPDERWLELGTRRLRADPTLAGVEGAIRLDPAEAIDAVRSRLVLNLHGGAWINASMFYRAAAYRSVGGSRLMWQRPATNFREDTDLAKRIQRDVGPIAFEPDAFVIHPADPVGLRRLIWLGRSFLADAQLRRLHPDVFPSVRRRPLARLRIRLATVLTLAIPGLAARRTRTVASITILAVAVGLSAQVEFEIREAGVKRSFSQIATDTLRRVPRMLLWAVAAGSARLQGEAIVRMRSGRG
jgi:glycosyltransferase involved in cell wall biosynthesis